MAALTCPTVNSYKRLAARPRTREPHGLRSYAAYGGNDRTQMLRIPDPGRVENRCIDGSANPYLAFSAQIAAGLDGIERGLDPGDPRELNLLTIT